jgi:hypothetical protein
MQAAMADGSIEARHSERIRRFRPAEKCVGEYSSNKVISLASSRPHGAFLIDAFAECFAPRRFRQRAELCRTGS